MATDRTALALAALRAQGFTPASEITATPDAADLSAAGLQLLTVATTQGPQVTTVFRDDLVERIVEQRRPLRKIEALTFATCLRGCWPDEHRPPYPGVEVNERYVIRAVPYLDGIERGTPNEFRGMVRAALRTLRSTRWLEPTPGVVRLGPRVAVLTHDDIADLRGLYPHLPKVGQQ